MHLFYDPSFPENTSLSEEESKHANRVLRLKTGDQIGVINGKGSFFTCSISELGKKSCTLQIVGEKKDTEKPYRIHVAIAPTKNIDRIEWFVEKCVEFGVDEISFILTKNSERKIIKIERIQRIAIAAMKQSQRAYLPQINELTTFKEFVKTCKDEIKGVAHLVDNNRNHIKDVELNKSYCILIGPEGDFRPEEVDLALAEGFTPMTLGDYRLRTETAGVAACHSINFLHE
ncbi:16S rRNA (uracil(1498)-N(3))-methyltransferase [Cyclobacteriaceae bacterium]|nr:16S rRNA (uracil(1498)-N(3))-methyltransferase [Cyclobacteriaceae bacterium]